MVIVYSATGDCENIYLFDIPETVKRVREAERSYRTGKARVLRSWDELD